MSKVKLLMAEGFAFPCACCQKLWRAKSRGLDVCEVALGELDCGGPVSGMSFPLYEGPLTPQSIGTTCFVCGERAAEAVTTPAQPEAFVGICKRHLPVLDKMVVKLDLHVRRRTGAA